MRYNRTWVGTSPEVIPENTEQERREPRGASFVSDVAVPVCQSVFTGLLCGAVVAFVVGRTSWRGDVGSVFVGVALFSGLLSWLALLGQTRRLLWGVEKLVRRDLDHDGTVGRPQEVETLEVEVRSGNHTRVIPVGWLGLGDDKLRLLASDLARGRSLSEADLGQDKTLFSRGINQFREVRSKLVQAGLVQLVNESAPNLGYTLTPAGRAVFDRLSSGNTHTLTHTDRVPVSTYAREAGEGGHDST